MSEPTGRQMKRAPVRAWLVTGPVGRLAGFLVEFSAALLNLAKARIARLIRP